MIRTVQTVSSCANRSSCWRLARIREDKRMTEVGTTHEDLERFLAEHHLVGAGLRLEGRAAPRQGNIAAHWKWDGIYRGLMRSGEIVTVGPNGMTGMRSVVGIEARTDR